MALRIEKYFYDRPSQPIGVSWFAVSCRGPKDWCGKKHRQSSTTAKQQRYDRNTQAISLVTAIKLNGQKKR